MVKLYLFFRLIIDSSEQTRNILFFKKETEGGGCPALQHSTLGLGNYPLRLYQIEGLISFSCRN